MSRNSWIGASVFLFLGIMAGVFGIRYFVQIAASFAALLMFVVFMMVATLWQRVIYTARDQPDVWTSSASFVISVLFGIALAMTVW
jgi:uncharacterized membrane protein HdeD (DUF308 family)